MGGAEAVERLSRGAGFLRRRRDYEHLLPDFGGALEILFPERADAADVQQRFPMTGIDAQRPVELCERAIRLVHVVVRDAEVGAAVDVLRMDRQLLLIPLRCALEPARA